MNAEQVRTALYKLHETLLADAIKHLGHDPLDEEWIQTHIVCHEYKDGSKMLVFKGDDSKKEESLVYFAPTEIKRVDGEGQVNYQIRQPYQILWEANK